MKGGLNEGASNLTLDKPSARKLKAQVRRAPGKDQVEVLKLLVMKYPEQTKNIMKELDS